MSKAQQRYRENKIQNAVMNCLVYQRAKESHAKRFKLPFRRAMQQLNGLRLTNSEFQTFVSDPYPHESMFK
jgi:hypothetical protein